jgi:hypothetical protein
MRAAAIRLALSCAAFKLLAFFAGLGSTFCSLLLIRRILLILSMQDMPHDSLLGLVGSLAFSLSLGLIAVVFLRRSFRPHLRHSVAPAE